MNPFKNIEDFEEEINVFLRKHKSFIANHGKRISDYFEMSCYNKIVKHYDSQGFEIIVKNLFVDKFKYKLSPSGYPENFSYFEIVKQYSVDGLSAEHRFEVHHNLTIQSGHQEDIYLTPDISVINTDSIISEFEHYMVERSTKKFCYIKNEDLQTFFEVKNFTPFPELLYNFVGQYNELKMKSIEQGAHTEEPNHIAPSLMISGKRNEHTQRIKNSLEKRYRINILFDLFETSVSHQIKNYIKSANHGISIKDLTTKPFTNPLLF